MSSTHWLGPRGLCPAVSVAMVKAWILSGILLLSGLPEGPGPGWRGGIRTLGAAPLSPHTHTHNITSSQNSNHSNLPLSHHQTDTQRWPTDGPLTIDVGTPLDQRLDKQPDTVISRIITASSSASEDADTVTGQDAVTWQPDISHTVTGFKSSDPKDVIMRRRQQQTDDLLTKLPQYDIVIPSLVDHQGDLISYDVTQRHHRRKRRRRSLTDNDTQAWTNAEQRTDVVDNTVFYKLRAFGKDIDLNVTLNSDLVAPRYTAEYWGTGHGVERRHYHLHHCHYRGHIRNNTESMVAISNCHGLHGMFVHEGSTYFVEPMWNETHTVSSSRGLPHIVYQASHLSQQQNRTNSTGHCGVKDDITSSLPHWWINKSLPTLGDIKNKARHHRKDKWRHRRRTKRSVSTERHVETLVVVDKMMVGYYGKLEIEPYVLTVMNIVAKLFHDASIGNPINIIVTRLVLLSEDQPSLEINHNADRSLKSFCHWQQVINPAEGSTSNKHHGIAHHDNAILLTRYDICTDRNQPCGTLGLAPVEGMCQPDRSCSLNEDIGLASAFTIAHEIGHNFGMQHDGQSNGCGKPGYDGAKIMAAQLTQNTDLFSWSTCSEEYITSFLDSGRGRCLDNVPPEMDFEFPTQRPGQMHDVEQQCQLQFGSWSKHCKPAEVCQELHCTDQGGQCITNSIPAAEGTTCSSGSVDDGWCYRGGCVERGHQPDQVDGGWSHWSDWGSCTRTCGGGVESSERLCNNPTPSHGGDYCIGERKRYKSCNTDDCPINSTDFREMQCSHFNDIPFRNKYYKWTVFSGEQENGQVLHLKPCALNCLAMGFNFYTERRPKVRDGTRCYPDSLDMCINGECRHVGCDRVLGSDAVEDKCRVCGGDGSTCETIHGSVVDPMHSEGDSRYQEVIRIPQGAMHIVIEEHKLSRNYLALRSFSGKYFINGAWTIDWPRKFEVANTVFHYVREIDHPEKMTALGPTSEDLVVMILLQEKNKGIKYQYNMALSNASHNSTEFIWTYSPWSQCTVSCAKGFSKSVPICVRKDDMTAVKSKYCTNNLKPSDKVKYCNEEPCPAEWEIGEWSECSRTCGGGHKTRSAVCLRRIDQVETEVLDQAECSTTRPPTSLSCSTDTCPPHWATDMWSNCYPSCGPGKKTRNVYCVSSEGEYLHDHYCDEEKRPENKNKCDSPACPPPKWVTGQWGECTAKCGKGQQMRNVQCRAYTGQHSAQCVQHVKPTSMKQCEGDCEAEEEVKECKDVNTVAYCPLVLKFKFCNRSYFRQMCCKTCADAPNSS